MSENVSDNQKSLNDILLVHGLRHQEQRIQQQEFINFMKAELWILILAA